MTNSKNTKKALLMSTISLVLCFSMLIGTTFAWFTDEVNSGVNQIVAGNLDVDVQTADGTSIEKYDKLFSKVALWEPGVVAYENITVVNKGTLALKYGLGINFNNENEIVGTGAKLSQILQIAVVPGGVDINKSREEIVAGINSNSWRSLSSWYESGKLLPEEKATAEEPSSVTYGIVIWWKPSDLDNNWNVQNGKTTSDGKALHIDLGIKLTAWQKDYESDSFNNQYDASLVVNTVAEAEARIALGKDVVLFGANEPDEVLDIPAEYTGTVTLNSVAIKAVNASGDANLVIDGVVTVDANGTVATVANETIGTSAISAAKKLNISGSGVLTAIGTGRHACGIFGGESTTISNITIDYVAGGYAGGVGSDTKYYKDAPEGGAAIGGAVISLNKVTVNKAIGGSKAAGIGARYHTGVTVNITDSTIGYVEGGVSAAAIGGSRVSGNPSHAEDVNITIADSTITAQGGAYGAGIGSGYDTHCPTYTEVKDNYPICTINISGNSVINATGGKYAAGVGTGYHHAGLDGEIASTVTVNAVSGEKFYKNTYTTAMDIGFGVVDPAREGKENPSSINYKGTEIGIPEVVKSVSTAKELADALAAGEKTINISGEITLTSSLSANNVTFVGMNDGAAINFAGYNIGGDGNSTITYKNLNLSTISLPNDGTNGERYGWYGGIDYVRHTTANYENCTITGVFTTYSTTVNVSGCTFNPYIQDGEEFYHIFVYGSSVVNVTESTFNYADRAIKIYNEGGTKNIELNLTNSTFLAAEGAKVNKALVNIDSTALTSVKLTIKNITVDDALNGVKIHNAEGNSKVTVTVE